MSKRKRHQVEEEDVKPKRKSLIRQSMESDDNDMIDQSQQPDFHDNATMGEEAEVGIIEQVMVKNFMNHNIQDIRFGPQVNFVIGRNGSGKSAILTAIVVGLGGKATITNRGSSIKGFIKEGKSSAEVMVKLRNRGQDAYHPDMYGPSIIVERRIAKESSSYKLKSSTGKLVSTKREELSHILEHFNIQVENPIVVLNQETSRNFLHSKSPNDKYKFFLRATQLEQMKQDYINANESKEVALDMLKRKKETLPTLEKEVFEWEQKYKALSSLKDLKAKMDRLREEFIWALISEREKGLEPTAKEMKTEEARTPKFDQKVIDSENELKANQEKHTTIEKELTALGCRVETIEPQYREARREKEDKKKQAKATSQEVRRVQREVLSNQRDRESILTRVLEIQNSAQKDFEAEHQARKMKIAQLEEQLQEFQAKKRSTEHELEQFRSATQQLKRDENQARGEQDEVSRHITDMKRHLQTLEGSRSNRLKRFGAFMPQLIQKIDDAHKRGVFHQKPVGPVGAHFSLRDQKWALAVETCLKGLIFAFCVHDHHDERELEKIMKSACPGRIPLIIASAFINHVHDISRNRPQTNKYPTVLEVLKIDSPIIANCLIDQQSVESILLFDDIKESRDVMADNPPRGARQAYNIEGDQINCAPFRYYSSSESKVKVLVASVEDDIKRCKDDLCSLDDQLKKKRDHMNTTARDLQTQKQEERKTQTRIMRLQEHIGKTTMELNELNNIEEPTAVDVKTLEEEVGQLEILISGLQEQVSAKQEIHNQANIEFLDYEKKFQLLDLEMSTISEQTDSIKHQLALAENAMQTARNHKQHYETKRKDHEKKINELRKKYDKYKAELEEETIRAEAACKTRVKSKRSSQNLESEIKQIGKQITAEEKIRGNHDEITTKYHEMKESFNNIRKEVSQLTAFLKALAEVIIARNLRYKEFVRYKADLLKSAFTLCLRNLNFTGRVLISHKTRSLNMRALHRVMTNRQGQYAIFRRMIATRAKFFFIVMLGTRKYSGKMVFEHKKELLELNVMPSAESQEVNKDMRSLSGGERSFATVCFILSLWDAMESPFRCLDEFDVFMDMVNRRISMDMMMSVAQTQKGRQFIFLTPQNMSHVNIDPSMVKIFQMRAPERGQGALPFQAVNRNEEEEEEEETNEDRS